MRNQATFLVRADATKDAYGAVREGFTPGATVWASIHTPDERTRQRWARYDSPVTDSMSMAPHASCVAGNRIQVGAVVYEIVGVDTTRNDVVVADVREVL